MRLHVVHTNTAPNVRQFFIAAFHMNFPPINSIPPTNLFVSLHLYIFDYQGSTFPGALDFAVGL